MTIKCHIHIFILYLLIKFLYLEKYIYLFNIYIYKTYRIKKINFCKCAYKYFTNNNKYLIINFYINFIVLIKVIINYSSN